MAERFTRGEMLVVRKCMVFACYASGRSPVRVDGETVTFIRNLPRGGVRLIPHVEVLRSNGEVVSVYHRYLTRPA